ncbi:MAG: hypothetical protein KAS49_07770, partial [Candidatus Cloacimonetes bacterium]|nr:hypothetical protein [Candidatus Cloacimonadota bacterium]
WCQGGKYFFFAKSYIMGSKAISFERKVIKELYWYDASYLMQRKKNCLLTQKTYFIDIPMRGI